MSHRDDVNCHCQMCSTAELNAVLRRAVERMERRQKRGLATEQEAEQLAAAVGEMARGEAG